MLFLFFRFLAMRMVLDVLFVAALVLTFVLWTVGHLQLLTIGSMGCLHSRALEARC